MSGFIRIIRVLQFLRLFHPLVTTWLILVSSTWCLSFAVIIAISGISNFVMPLVYSFRPVIWVLICRVLVWLCLCLRRCLWLFGRGSCLVGGASLVALLLGYLGQFRIFIWRIELRLIVIAFFISVIFVGLLTTSLVSLAIFCLLIIFLISPLTLSFVSLPTPSFVSPITLSSTSPPLSSSTSPLTPSSISPTPLSSVSPSTQTTSSLSPSSLPPTLSSPATTLTSSSQSPTLSSSQ